MTKLKYGLRQHPKQKFNQDDHWIPSSQLRKTNKNLNKKKVKQNKSSTTEVGQISTNNGATGNDPIQVGLYDDDKVRETNILQLEEKVSCIKCQLICKNALELALHEKSCLVISNKDSFLKYTQPRVMVEDISKVALPLTQETVEMPEEGNTVNSDSEIDLAVTHEKAENHSSPVVKGHSLPVNMDAQKQQNSAPANKEVNAKKQAPKAKITRPKTPTPKINQARNERNEGATMVEPLPTVVDTNIHVPTKKDEIISVYEEIVKWRRNLFDLPKGNNGKRFIELLTKLINTWCTTKEDKTMKLVMIMPSLLLQRTAKGVKARENKQHLERRLELWENEKFVELLEEGLAIQNRLKYGRNNKQNGNELVKRFRALMCVGNINGALRLLSKSNNAGVLAINDETIQLLHEKHPEGEPLHEEMLLEGPVKSIHPVIFDDIDSTLVQKIALKMKGAAGPSNFDANDWRNMIGSRRYGNSSTDLCIAIANMAKVVATENLTNDNVLSSLLACRLIPLDKNPGLRPIGIGEVLRRIIGKMVVWVLRPDLQEAAGDLQLCVGQEGGCEAGVHAMHAMFEEDRTHGIIQIDANNAFNTINRKVFMHNIRIICPEIGTFVLNCYSRPARLFVMGGIEIQSLEGTTQGAPEAMPVYAESIIPLMDMAADPLNRSEDKVRQSAFADDLAAAGTINELKWWWDIIVKFGPFLGYYPKPEKSWLIVKPQFLEQAKEIFSQSGLKITTEGRRHLGAVVGSAVYKKEYVDQLVDSWIEDLNQLAEIAKVEPHLAYSAYVFGFQHKYTYFMRTLPDIQQLLLRLDAAIDDFIRIMLNNYHFSDLERTWFSLPVKFGGLGIIVPSQLCDWYYENSKAVTKCLVDRIINQHKQTYTQEGECYSNKQAKAEIKSQKKVRDQEKLENLRVKLTVQQQKILEATTEKGASSWLNTLPLKSHNFYLNKQIFWDSLYLRFGIPIPHLPLTCVCGTKFDIQHALTCKHGGFIGIRHNEVRDLTAEMLSEICQDVAIEPLLTPLTGEQFNLRSTNTDEHARVDVAARGVWMRGSRAFFDIRVFNPLAQCYSQSTLKAAHKSNENSKKREYNQRILEVEHGSFTPLVFSSFGGMSIECNNFYNRVAEKIAEKRDIAPSIAKSWLRTKLSFSLLRTTHLCIRGSRTKLFESEKLKDVNIRMATVDTRLDGQN